jgi:chaperonin GroES
MVFLGVFSDGYQMLFRRFFCVSTNPPRSVSHQGVFATVQLKASKRLWPFEGSCLSQDAPMKQPTKKNRASLGLQWLNKEKTNMAAKLRPLHDRILVERVEEEEQTKGGIIIPDSAKKKPAEGKVMAVGEGKVGDDGKKTPLELKVGDRILFGKYSGTEVKIEGQEYLIMREDDVLGVIE